MKIVSIVCPVYNEIKRIEKCLSAAIGEADEIILSDNGSTDGTSDICLDFSKKYKEIKYYRHKENMGVLHNVSFAFSKFIGKYVRYLRARDLIYKNSTKNLLYLLETNKDAVAAIQKYTISLDENWQPKNFSYENKFIESSLKSDSVIERIKGLSKNLWKTSRFLGLMNGKVTKKYLPKHVCDVSFFFKLTTIGKVFIDKETPFMTIGKYLSCKNYMKDFNDRANLGENVYIYLLSILCGIMDVMQELQNSHIVSEKLSNKLMQIIYPQVVSLDCGKFSKHNLHLISPHAKKYHEKAIILIKKFEQKLYPKAMYSKKIFLWGIGAYSENKIVPFLKDENLNIYAFMDNKVSKGNTLNFLDKQVYSPEQVLSKFRNDFFIVIASLKYQKEMQKKCKEFGLKEYEDFYAPQ